MRMEIFQYFKVKSRSKTGLSADVKIRLKTFHSKQTPIISMNLNFLHNKIKTLLMRVAINQIQIK